jgi:hypothetical protein
VTDRSAWSAPDGNPSGVDLQSGVTLRRSSAFLCGGRISPSVPAHSIYPCRSAFPAGRACCSHSTHRAGNRPRMRTNSPAGSIAPRFAARGRSPVPTRATHVPCTRPGPGGSSPASMCTAPEGSNRSTCTALPRSTGRHRTGGRACSTCRLCISPRADNTVRRRYGPRDKSRPSYTRPVGPVRSTPVAAFLTRWTALAITAFVPGRAAADDLAQRRVLIPVAAGVTVWAATALRAEKTDLFSHARVVSGHAVLSANRLAFVGPPTGFPAITHTVVVATVCQSDVRVGTHPAGGRPVRAARTVQRGLRRSGRGWHATDLLPAGHRS